MQSLFSGNVFELEIDVRRDRPAGRSEHRRFDDKPIMWRSVHTGVAAAALVSSILFAIPTVSATALVVFTKSANWMRPEFDKTIGDGIASLLQFRLEPDQPTDDDLVSPRDLFE